MKDEVGGFGDDLVVTGRNGRERKFQPFLTDLLRDAGRALCNKTRRVAALRLLRDALFDHRLKQRKKRQRLGCTNGCIAKTTARTQVANRTRGACTHQHTVPIAVCAHGNKLKCIAGGLTFFPQTLPAAAEEHDAPAFERGVHVAEHQYPAAVRVLHDRRQKSRALREVERVDVVERKRRTLPHSRTSIPALRSSCFKSAMASAPE